MSFEIVVVGTSTGGLRALPQLLGSLHKDFPVPVVIVQHRTKDADHLGLCEFLSRGTELEVVEPEDKETINPGHAYVAPRDYHLLIEGGSFALTTEAPVAFARPSIDLLFESAANEYKANTIGVILTGASHDGALGLARIKDTGGTAIVEDPDTAACGQMPLAALASTHTDLVLPLHEIGPRLQRLTEVTKVEHAR